MAEHRNATLVRRGYDAFAAADIDSLARLIAPDAVQHMPGHNVFSGDHRGRDAILTMYGKLAERSGGTLKVELEELYANDDQVVTVYHSTGTREGRRLDTRHALVFQVRDNQVVELTDVADNEDSDDAFWA